MSLPRHRVPGELFDRIASGDGGAAALRLLHRVEYSRRLTLVRAVLTLAQQRRPDLGGVAGEVWAALTAVQRRSPEALRQVLCYPSAGPANLRLLRELSGGQPAPSLEPLAALTAAAVVRAALPTTVVLRVRGGWVALPSLGAARFPDAAEGEPAVVRVTRSGATVTAGEQVVRVPRDPFDGVAPGWSGLRRIAAPGSDTTLLLDDVDPFRFPASPWCVNRLPERDLRHWQDTVAEGWRLLCAVHPGPAEELGAGTRVLVPLARGPDGTTISASSSETHGCTALSTPPSPRALALALTHEIQHTKFAALLHALDLVDPAAVRSGARFYAPWRSDPRPLTGLFHGAYAHLGVAGFWGRQRRVETEPAALSYAHLEFVRWREASWEATGVLLDSGHLTPLGRRFVTGMRTALAALRREPVPAREVERAREMAADHRQEWTRRHTVGSHRK
ncbi:HEXXH motif domain-containing protein [Streptomyces odontomachi]|uniref:HEXXH motif domain-containing protein n=1 Tax=Streptomyces odontomachi TaxID=2944940 RepID=UPI00210C467A|nr:HEXXH motif domain-containing protein [Streptomyces sp. ODS25]